MNPGNDTARILLVEDDPTTRSYLEGLVARVPAQVRSADGMAAALQLAAEDAYDLLLIDARLPDGTGPGLLRRLRDLGIECKALAHTAARPGDELEDLRQAGFDEVLLKPVVADDWLDSLRSHLGLSFADASAAVAHGAAVQPTPALWDDAIASRALGGNTVNIHALRELFLGELPGQLDTLHRGGKAADDTLHRLRASCALVGAARLQSAIEQGRNPPTPRTMARIIAVGQAMLEAGQPSAPGANA